MKKITFLAFFLAVTVSGFGQGFYFRAGLGYGIPQASQTLDGTGSPYNGTQTNINSFNTSYSLKNASFSSGMQGDFGFGYMFSEHVGVELAANIGLAPTKYTFNENYVEINGVESNVSVVQQANTPFILMPALVLETGKDKWKLYSRMGLALPLNTQVTQDVLSANVPGTGAIVPEDDTWQIKSSFSLGFSAALGAKYQLSDKVSLWGEVSLLSLSVYVKQANLQGVVYDGVNIPLDSIISPHTISFSKNVTVDTNQNKQPTFSQPFSNIGFKVGVSFNLSSNRHPAHRHDDEEGDTKKPFRRR